MFVYNAAQLTSGCWAAAEWTEVSSSVCAPLACATAGALYRLMNSVQHTAIHSAAGPELLAECRTVPEVRPGVRCPTGEARITRRALGSACPTNDYACKCLSAQLSFPLPAS